MPLGNAKLSQYKTIVRHGLILDEEGNFVGFNLDAQNALRQIEATWGVTWMPKKLMFSDEKPPKRTKREILTRSKPASEPVTPTEVTNDD